ncbi:MAG: bifunctional oligoribonuclease/PAP phosphatase NrnA [Prevotellaceae bacterium]|nr:bifunctional oligoribonuclease/PAP phosphatase NrnA [Prevotellaceae bacterium]
MKNLLSPDELLQLVRLLRESRKIVITAHRGPDGDAVGSVLAFASYLRGIGKRADIVVPNAFPDFLRWMPGSERICLADHSHRRAAELLAGADLVCMLDYNATSRLQSMQSLVERSKAPRLMIDHHLDPDPKAACFVISRPDMCATCEVLFSLLWQLGHYESMTTDEAACIYTGMMTDTGGFTYASTRPEIYEIISLLLAKGIDKDKIYRNVFNCYSPDRLRFMGYVLYEKLRLTAGGKAAYFAITREDMKRFRYIRGDSEGLVNMPLQIRGMRLSIALREDTERDVVRVSLRSVDDFPANRMAEEFFNGGGHLNAAGGELPFPMDEAVGTVERAIEAYTELL